MAYTLPDLPYAVRRARAAHRRADDGDPPRQAPRGLRQQRQRGARGLGPRRPAGRGAAASRSTASPDDKRNAVRNNGGGHYNHSLFWESLSGSGGGEPGGALGDAIDAAFGSFADFQGR